ncbi:MAG: hypothetical protein CL908_14110 [Deltaproteobacteria bacterium]|nr:hypothetical protein [Deltaproteobacteria bacterium]
MTDVAHRISFCALVLAFGIVNPFTTRATILDGAPWLELFNAGHEIPIPALTQLRSEALENMEFGFTDLLARSALSWEADGTVIERITLIRRFFDADGIDRAGEITIFAMPSHESIRIGSAYTVTPDGVRIDLDKRSIQVTDDVEPRIFSGRKKVVLPFPGLTTGATSVLSYTTRFRATDWPMPWARSFQLQLSHPIERMEIVAKSLPARMTWRSSDTDLSCTTSGRDLHCKKTEIAPLPPDIDLTMALEQIPTVSIGERLSWQEVSDRVGRVVQRQIDKGVPTGTLEKIIRTADSGDAQWEAMFRFVADDVRYLGLEHGNSAVVPHAPASTLEKRYGDCKDKVTLLVALAREAGLKAYPVLVATDRFESNPLILPSSIYFNHMIVCFEPNPNAVRCGDPTLSNTASADTALTFAGQLALPLTATRDAEPIILPTFDRSWSVGIETQTKIGCDGGVSRHTERHLAGLAKLYFKASYDGIEPSMRNRFIVNETKRVANSSALPRVELSDFRERRGPITIADWTEIPSVSNLPTEYDHVEQDPWLVNYASTFRAQNQTYPIWNPGVEIRSIHRFEFCEELEIRYTGPALDLVTDFGTLRREYEKGSNRLVVDSTFNMPSGAIEADQFDKLNHFLNESLAQTLIWFELRRDR